MAHSLHIDNLPIRRGYWATIIHAELDLAASEIFYIPGSDVESNEGFLVSGLKDRRIWVCWQQTGGAGGTILVEADWLDLAGNLILTQSLPNTGEIYPYAERMRLKAYENIGAQGVTGGISVRMQ